MLNQSRSYHYKSTFLAVLIILLVVVSLACSLGGAESSNIIRIKNLLPTLTPTGLAVSQAAAPAELAHPPVDNSLNPQPSVVPSTPTRRTPAPILTPPGIANQMVGSPYQLANLAPTSVPQPIANSTPAPTAVVTPTSIVPANPVVTPTVNSTPPLSSPNPNPTPTLPPLPDPTEAPKLPVPGWSFAGVHASIDEGHAIVVGELINNTGAPQSEVQVSGVLYDQYDRVIVDGVDSLDYIPVETIPVGARIPFELVVESEQSIYRIDLVGLSVPTENGPRQDFQFAGVSQRVDPSGMYCIEGSIKNLGAPLEENLTVVATTYDSQGQVVSFGEHAEGSPSRVSADQVSRFDICIDPVNQQIASHELKAVGL